MKFNPFLEGYGGYVLQQLQDKAKHLTESGVDVINLTIGDPKGALFSPAISSISSSLQTMTQSQYPKTFGTSGLREAITDWIIREYGEQFDPEAHVLSCNGTKEAVFSIPLALDWSSGKRIFIPSLSYPVYKVSAGVFGIPYTELPLSESTQFLPDLNAISDEEWRTCGLFWLNSPHNPTTSIASRTYIEQLLEKAREFDFLVCSDECYNEFYYNEKPVSFLEYPESDQWIVFRSLSKRSHMTAFRSGAIISKNKPLLAHYKKLRASMGVGTPTFIQEGAISAWNDDRHPKEFCAVYQRVRHSLLSSLKKNGFIVFGADAGFYLWVKHPNFQTSESLANFFLSVGILVTPGTAFGSDGEGYVRLVYCETEKRMNEAIKRIKELK